MKKEKKSSINFVFIFAILTKNSNGSIKKLENFCKEIERKQAQLKKKNGNPKEPKLLILVILTISQNIYFKEASRQIV